jgi:two-component system response regulator YesN
MPHVLVIDDDPGTLDTFERILHLEGVNVATAATGREGLELGRMPTLDLVLADLYLPDIGGTDILRQLRLENIDVPFVIITAHWSTESALEAGKLGAVAYIGKPIWDDELVEIVTSYARHRVPENATDPHKPDEPQHPLVVKARRVIERRFGEAGLRSQMVAAELGVSTEHLCRVFEKHTGGVTLMTFLSEVRLREACRLLESSRLSMKEISAHCGFYDGSHFDHVFKEVHGKTPTQYRLALHAQRRR